MRLRIVIEHVDGPKKGIHEIIGTLDQMDPKKPALAVGDLPTHSTLLNADLVAVKRSYVLYRGVISAEISNKNFNPSQR